jgi:hypothetical protein
MNVPSVAINGLILSMAKMAESQSGAPNARDGTGKKDSYLLLKSD